MRLGELPEKLRPFTCLGFSPIGNNGVNYHGDCLFCGKSDKLYVNSDTQEWHCVSAACDKGGNLYTFFREIWSMYSDEFEGRQTQRALEKLAEDRGFEKEVFEKYGFVWDGTQWLIPVLNAEGEVVNFRRKKIGEPVKAVTGVPLSLWGVHNLAKTSVNEDVYICEGEWDAIAIQLLLGEDTCVVAFPGAGTGKKEWFKFFEHRRCKVCFDYGAAGQAAATKKCEQLLDVTPHVWRLEWPADRPDGYDVRDFVNGGGLKETFLAMFKRFGNSNNSSQKKPKGNSGNGEGNTQDDEKKNRAALPLLSEGSRPPFDEVIATYGRWLELTPELVGAIRVAFATYVSNWMDGEPLWVHIAGPPGCGKTEIVTSIADCSRTILRSKLTPHCLVSGYPGYGDKDPSLLPKLFGNTLVVKDYTTVLQMPRNAKEEISSVLRDAFDGRVEQQFGNKVFREYEGYFSLLTGVTTAIFGEINTPLGERFLIYHVLKGVGFEADDAIEKAMDNVGLKSSMKDDFAAAARGFLEFEIEDKDWPKVPREYKQRLIGLSQIVAMLRASVQKDMYSKQLLYRPQHEMGTRIAMQLTKLLKCLGMLRWPAEVTEEDYHLAARIALDTCIGFNLEILLSLLHTKNGQTRDELAENTRIPVTTIADHIENLEMLGILYLEKVPRDTPGRPQLRYFVTDTVIKHWERSELAKLPDIFKSVRAGRMTLSRKKKEDDAE